MNPVFSIYTKYFIVPNHETLVSQLCDARRSTVRRVSHDCETIKTSPAFLFLATILPPIQAIERSFPDYCAKQYYALPPERYVK